MGNCEANESTPGNFNINNKHKKYNNITYLHVYQKLISMDFDEELSMKAAQKYSTDIQRATLFVLKNQNNQTDTTSNVIDEDKDDDKDDEKIITEGWLDLNNIPTKK
eukprot:155523_1